MVDPKRARSWKRRIQPRVLLHTTAPILDPTTLDWLAEALVTHGFRELGLDQITATITPDNLPSKKIAEKLGMKFDRHILLLGVPTDLYRLRRT